MPMIGVCILCKVLETTKHKKTASFNQTVTAVTSTHQLHVWKVIQPVNDFTMGKLPSTILITLYLSTSREQKSSRKKMHSFSFYLMDRKKKDFFMGGCFLFFHSSSDLPKLHLLGFVKSTKLLVSAVESKTLNRDLVCELFYLVHSCLYFCLSTISPG